MSRTSSALRRDANSVPIQDPDGLLATKTMALAGGTANDPGDYDGTGNPATLFTVTGDVIVVVFAVCSVNLAGDTATIEVGIAGNTAAIIARTTATDIDAAKIWLDTGPATVETMPTSGKILYNGTDIIQTVATANITAGTLKYYCFWRPLSDDGDVVAA